MEKTLKIEGMTCMHCANAVKKELEKLDGVDKVIVNLDTKNAVVEISNGPVTDEQLFAAVDEAGYKVVEITEI